MATNSQGGFIGSYSGMTTFNANTRIVRIGKLRFIHLDITTSGQIPDWTTELVITTSGGKDKASFIEFWSHISRTDNGIPYAIILSNGTNVQYPLPLPVGTYRGDLIYIAEQYFTT